MPRAEDGTMVDGIGRAARAGSALILASLVCLAAVLASSEAGAADPSELELSVVAAGTVGGETIRIEIGGVPLATETLGTAAQTFDYLTDLEGPVEVFFDSSPPDGSAVVDNIVIGGLAHQTEDPSTMTSANGTQCAEGALETEALSCVGASFEWAQPIVTFLQPGDTPLENVECGGSPDLDPEEALFGAWVDEDSDPAVTGEVEAVEALLGAPLKMIRRFTKWDPNPVQVFPRPEDFSNRDAGRTLHLSIKPADRWADIASARPGSELYAEAYNWGRTVCEFGAPMFLTFHHEPEGQNDRDAHGEPAEFKAAFTAMHDLFEQHDVSNVSWVWVMAWYSFYIDDTGDPRDPDLYYPPVTDAIGFDPYNFQACIGATEWTSWDFVSQPFLDWVAATAPGSPLMIPEFGTEIDPNDPNRRAAWIDEVTADLNTSDWDDLVGVAYFNRGPVSAEDTCDWQLDNDPPALDAWRSMAESSRFSPDPNLGTTVSIGDATTAEGATGEQTEVEVIVSLSSPAVGDDLSVDVTTSDGTAMAADADYLPSTQTVTFSDGQSSKVVSIEVLGDDREEADETLHVELSNTGVLDIADGTGDIVITNDDPHLPVLTVSDVVVVEGDAGFVWAKVTFRLDERYGEQVRVDFHTVDGTATVGDGDYLARSGTVVFGVNKTMLTRGIKIFGDTDVEPDEVLQVIASNPVNATLGDDTAEITIVSNEPPTGPNDGITIGVGDASTAEGDAGSTTTVDIEVSLSAPATDPLSIEVATSDGSATIDDDDYSAHQETLVFASGEQSQTVSVEVIGDDVEEPDEQFSLVLSDPVDILIGDGVGTLSIVDDDTPDPPPAVSVGDVSVIEGGDGESPTVDVTVSLMSPAVGTETVRLSTSGGTATADVDYEPVSSELVSFGPGSVSATFTLTIIGDDNVEGDETFGVVLSDPGGVAIDDGTAVVTINDDDEEVDPLPVLSVEDVEVIEGNGGYKWAQVTFRLDAGSRDRVEVDFTTEDGTATTADGDYQTRSGTVVFGVNKRTLTRGIRIYGDTKVEANELLTLVISNPLFATIGDDTAEITIIDND